jgi:hypothetical protein
VSIDVGSGGANVGTVLECPRPELGPAPDASLCATEVNVCDSVSVDPTSCSWRPFPQTMARIFSACGADCGYMTLALQSGCVAAFNIDWVGVSESGRATREELEACLRERMLGTRWDCAPSDGWTGVAFGSCLPL